MNPDSKIFPQDELHQVRQRLKEQGKVVVFTNGCFDLLHVGHVRYLQDARGLGDILIVAINSDDSVRQLKGNSRPIIPEGERAEVLAALACVDFVTVFDELTPIDLITKLRPDIHCKGGDYAKDKQIPEAQVVNSYGGQVRILSLVPGRSTSSLVQEILSRFGQEKHK